MGNSVLDVSAECPVCKGTTWMETMDGRRVRCSRGCGLSTTVCCGATFFHEPGCSGDSAGAELLAAAHNLNSRAREAVGSLQIASEGRGHRSNFAGDARALKEACNRFWSAAVDSNPTESTESVVSELEDFSFASVAMQDARAEFWGTLEQNHDLAGALEVALAFIVGLYEKAEDGES